MNYPTQSASFTPELQKLFLRAMTVGLIIHVAGYILVTNVTLHRNLFYLFMAIPFCSFCLLSLKSNRPLPKFDLRIGCAIGLFFLFTCISAVWSPDQHFLTLSLYSLFIICFLGSTIIVLSNISSTTFRRCLIVIPVLTAIYITIVSTAFLFAATGNISNLEILLMELGVDGFGHLREFGFVRAEWGKEIPRLDVGSNDLSNPVSAAMFFGLSFLMLVLYKEIGAGLPKTAQYIIAFFLLLGIVLTQSRGPLFSLVASLILYLALISGKKSFPAFCSAMLILAISLICLGAFFDDLRLFQIHNPIRLEIAQACLLDVQANPLLGIGFQLGNSPFSKLGVVYQHCHNIFIDTLRLGGVIGGGTLGLVILFAFKRAFESKSKHLLVPPLAFGLLCLQTDGTIPVSKPNIHWILLWLPIAVIALETKTQEFLFQRQN